MPVTLRLTFPAGRYHATPWGRHVNEGVAEWPPSPWRLLRALVAVWKRTLADPQSDPLPERQVERVLRALAARPPVFRLPPHRVAHTRHYMPWEKKGPADRTLVFDTFVAVGRADPVYVHWADAVLDVDDEVALRRLTANLTSLGRAEGWVEAAVVSFPEAGGLPEWNCEPAPAAADPVPVLCPHPTEAFADTHYPTHDPKNLRAGKVNPKNFLFAAPRWHLCLDTETVHAHKWPRVPGAEWVGYELRQAAPAPAPTRRPPAAAADRPTVARFRLDGPVLPLATDTVLVAEGLRAAVMSRFGKWCEQHPDRAAGFARADGSGRFASPVLSGKDAAGAVRADHRHAHYLPTAEGPDPRRLTHLTVWAADGFGPAEEAALAGLRTVGVGDGRLTVRLVGLGRPADFTAPLFGPSAVWESATPVVGPAHVGRSGRERYLAKAVRREVRRVAEAWGWPGVPQWSGWATCRLGRGR